MTVSPASSTPTSASPKADEILREIARASIDEDDARKVREDLEAKLQIKIQSSESSRGRDALAIKIGSKGVYVGTGLLAFPVEEILRLRDWLCEMFGHTDAAVKSPRLPTRGRIEDFARDRLHASVTQGDGAFVVPEAAAIEAVADALDHFGLIREESAQFVGNSLTNRPVNAAARAMRPSRPDDPADPSTGLHLADPPRLTPGIDAVV